MDLQGKILSISPQKKAPLIGERLPLSRLSNKMGYFNVMERLTSIQSDYPEWRSIIGDGNCFYRSFMFSLLEQLAIHSSGADKFHRFVLYAFSKHFSESGVMILNFLVTGILKTVWATCHAFHMMDQTSGLAEPTCFWTL